MMLKLLRQQNTLEERLSEPVSQPPQLKPNPQLTPLSAIETYGVKPTLKLNPEKVGKRVKKKPRGPRLKRIEEMKTLTPWVSHPETPAKKMQLRERAKPAKEKPEEKKKPRQASATEEPASKTSKVNFNEADFMQPLNVELPSLSQEVTTDDAQHHMHKARQRTVRRYSGRSAIY